jgi:hypothetical protein
MRTRAMRMVVVAALLAVPGLHLAAMAQPSSNLADYVLFAETKLRSKGVSVACGDIGVNQAGGKLIAPRYITVPDQVVADTVKLDEDAVVGELFANRLYKTTIPATPWTPPILPDLAAACGYPAGPFPACAFGSDVVVPAGTTMALGPGAYGNLILKGGVDTLGAPNGSVVELSGGDYTFCNVKVNRFSEVRVLAPVTVYVSGFLRMQANNYWGPAEGSGIPSSQIETFVAGAQVHYSRGAQVAATLCAPFAKCRLTRGGSYVGRVACNDVRTEEMTFHCGSPSGAFLD